MSFSHLSQERESGSPVKEVDPHNHRSLGPGSYIKVPEWPGKSPPKGRPKTSFGTSVDKEVPRHSHVERDRTVFQNESILHGK
ncbi:hypothetical protein AC1031_021517 [Aphanomyces cochlioides]|nr:hypothetical protein AC1031_021517 [Aphanomyces cochlioides]